jgi:tryptophanyl-tRNA synthetase
MADTKAGKKKRILSGMRPTGRIHLGNYEGALKNWVKLQDEFDSFHMVADWHALTNNPDAAHIHADTLDMVIDWMAAGLDPQKCTMFIQSHVREHAELHLLLSMATPLGWLERCPTFKELYRDDDERKGLSYGMLGYPVLQAADILIYKAHFVPVGEDQVPHLEITREVCRRFNKLYGKVFPEPQAKLTETPRILGADRRKMSKSLGNHIVMSDTPEAIRKKVLTMITDPKRPRKNDPGHPDECNVFTFHQLYNKNRDRIPEIEKGCRAGDWACFDCKQELATALVEWLEPFREKREALAADPDFVMDVLRQGNLAARRAAQAVMTEVREKTTLGSLIADD